MNNDFESPETADKCGVCGGDGSTCSEIHKRYNFDKPTYGYNTIDVIPAGSWDLDIRQYGYDNSADSNYLGRYLWVVTLETSKTRLLYFCITIQLYEIRNETSICSIVIGK